MDKPADKDRKARQAAKDERREDTGAQEAREAPDRGDEELVENEDHSMESLRRDDR
ncbi:hypothetical protein [Actinacidiphila reveromycinica]|nr:hypothetical protein [Streptomyces sp. SN-593]